MVMKSMNGVTLCLNRVHRCIIIKRIDKIWVNPSPTSPKLNEICIAKPNNSSTVAVGLEHTRVIRFPRN